MDKTALEWFLENIPERFKNALHNACQDEIIKAKELERDQTVIAFDMGRDETTRKFVEDGEEYYGKKYNKITELRNPDGTYGKWGTSGDTQTKVCENKIDGVCPLHNLFCKYPDCED